MRARHLVVTGVGRIELQDFDFSVDNLGPREIALQTHYTLISAGTELAGYTGKDMWRKYPYTPGYAACGEVIAAGKDVKDVQVGDRVFAYTPHASHARANRLYMRLADGLQEQLAPFTRMACVSITALRVSEAELGDHVAVLGLGLVGNFAAQLFRLAGCEVIGIDLSPRRLELAQACGVRHLLNPALDDARKRVQEITRGRMCEVVVEATGAPAVAEKAAQYAARLGEVVLVGSPRGEHMGDITTLLNFIHLWGNGCITFKGAHEWRYPVDRDPNGHVKHSLMRNVEIIMGLIADGRLQVHPLLTQVLSPSECKTAYDGLRDKKDEFVGVVFDWTRP